MKGEKWWRICPECGTEFMATYYLTQYCSPGCREKRQKRMRRQYTRKGVLTDIRAEYQTLKHLNPAKAQEIANEMEITEGKGFRDTVLDGLAPYDNPGRHPAPAQKNRKEAHRERQ